METNMKSTLSLYIVFTLIFGIADVLSAQLTDNVEIHGFISQGYIKTADNNYLAETEKGSFEFNELGINFGTELSPRLRMGMQLFAQDIGDIGNDKISLDWAYADYYFNNYLGIRVGKIKMTYGFLNEIRDFDMLRTFIFLPTSMYSLIIRDTMVAVRGTGAYGNIPIGNIGDLKYQFIGGVFEMDPEGGTSKIAENDNNRVLETEIKNACAGSLEWHPPITGLRLEFSSYLTTYVLNTELIFDQLIEISDGFFMQVANAGDSVVLDYHAMLFTAISLEYIWNNLIIQAEYGQIDHDSTIETDSTVFNPFTNQMIGLTEIDLVYKSIGYHGSISYRFSKLFELGTYYSESYANTDTRDNPRKYLKDFCFTVRMDVNPYWLVKLEGHSMNGTLYLFDNDNLDSQGVVDLKDNWLLFAAKISFHF